LHSASTSKPRTCRVRGLQPQHRIYEQRNPAQGSMGSRLRSGLSQTTWPKTVTRSISFPSMRRLASHLIAFYGSAPSRLIQLAGGTSWDFDVGPCRYRQPEGVSRTFSEGSPTRGFQLNILDVEVRHLNDIKQMRRCDGTVSEVLIPLH